MRESLPDEGFEERFRDSCLRRLPGWSVAPSREMWLGGALETLSGTLHEVDIVVKTIRTTAVAELKTWAAGQARMTSSSFTPRSSIICSLIPIWPMTTSV